MKEKEATNNEFFQMVDKLVKEKAEKEQEHVLDMEEVIDKAKSSVFETTWE